MGHERIGMLPRTVHWNSVVSQISSFSEDNTDISEIAKSTLKNVKAKFENMSNDLGVVSAFQFLVLYSIAGSKNDPVNFLKDEGINLSHKPSLLELSKAVSQWIENNIQSNEYASIAKSSAINALSEWQSMHQGTQSSMFENEGVNEIWREASDGAGFCEISRLFFAKFTERYLRYFLERAASSTMSSIYERERFNRELELHVQNISKHSFETAKITQSFAAGWYNKNTKEEVPSRLKTKGFLSKAFSKMQSEMLYEIDK